LDAGDWIAVVEVAVSLGALWIARVSAKAAIVSAGASKIPADLARASRDHADRPRFEMEGRYVDAGATRALPSCRHESSERIRIPATRRIAPSLIEIDEDAIGIDYHFRHSALAQPGGERALGVRPPARRAVQNYQSVCDSRDRPAL
jgi:hypothetical protein